MVVKEDVDAGVERLQNHDATENDLVLVLVPAKCKNERFRVFPSRVE